MNSGQRNINGWRQVTYGKSQLATMKKGILILFAIGLIALALQVLEVLGGILLIIIAILAFLAAIIWAIIHKLRG